MTVRIPSNTPLTVEQKERTRSIIIAGAFTAGMTALVLLCGGAQAAEVCKDPTDKTDCKSGLTGGKTCYKIVKAETMPSVNGGRYLMFDIVTWNRGKCEWNVNPKRVDEYAIGQTIAGRFAQKTEASAEQPKQ